MLSPSALMSALHTVVTGRVISGTSLHIFMSTFRIPLCISHMIHHFQTFSPFDILFHNKGDFLLLSIYVPRV